MSWTVELEEDPETGDLILPIPQEIIDLQGWKEHDVLEFTMREDGTWIITKRTLRSRIAKWLRQYLPSFVAR